MSEYIAKPIPGEVLPWLLIGMLEVTIERVGVIDVTAWNRMVESAAALTNRLKGTNPEEGINVDGN